MCNNVGISFSFQGHGSGKRPHNLQSLQWRCHWKLWISAEVSVVWLHFQNWSEMVGILFSLFLWYLPSHFAIKERKKQFKLMCAFLIVADGKFSFIIQNLICQGIHMDTYIHSPLYAHATGTYMTTLKAFVIFIHLLLIKDVFLMLGQNPIYIHRGGRARERKDCK